MKTPMDLVREACLEVSATRYHEPFEEMKLAALSLAIKLRTLESRLCRQCAESKP